MWKKIYKLHGYYIFNLNQHYSKKIVAPIAYLS